MSQDDGSLHIFPHMNSYGFRTLGQTRSHMKTHIGSHVEPTLVVMLKPKSKINWELRGTRDVLGTLGIQGICDFHGVEGIRVLLEKRQLLDFLSIRQDWATYLESHQGQTRSHMKTHICSHAETHVQNQIKTHIQNHVKIPIYGFI